MNESLEDKRLREIIKRCCAVAEYNQKDHHKVRFTIVACMGGVCVWLWIIVCLYSTITQNQGSGIFQAIFITIFFAGCFLVNVPIKWLEKWQEENHARQLKEVKQFLSDLGV